MYISYTLVHSKPNLLFTFWYTGNGGPTLPHQWGLRFRSTPTRKQSWIAEQASRVPWLSASGEGNHVIPWRRRRHWRRVLGHRDGRKTENNFPRHSGRQQQRRPARTALGPGSHEGHYALGCQRRPATPSHWIPSSSSFNAASAHDVIHEGVRLPAKLPGSRQPQGDPSLAGDCVPHAVHEHDPSVVRESQRRCRKRWWLREL